MIKLRKKISRVIVLFTVICLGLATNMVPVAKIPDISAATQSTYYASPTGNGTVCSLASPCSLAGVQDKVRTENLSMTGDIIVYLRGGTYTLTNTLTFTQLDSGTNGFYVYYKNYSGETPIISGGKTVAGWTLFDSVKNIYRSSAVSGGIETRQLYVDGVRAIRAKSTDGLPGAVETSTGYTTTDNNMQNWGNKDDVEFIYNQWWTHSRCGVSTISGTSIAMDDPCWRLMHNKAGINLTNTPMNPNYMENAYELLDAEGEWYLDRATDRFYYKPRVGENMETVTVIAPVLETLVSGTGTISSKIENIQFEGITFSYATWLKPNNTEGFAEIQANFTIHPDATKKYNYEMDTWLKMPTNVTFKYANGVKFINNKFNKLGAVGLGFETGSQNNVISQNEFTDISGSAIQIGGGTVNDHHPSDSRDIIKNNNVTKNYIYSVSSEYLGGVGIFAGYTEGTYIAQNEIMDMPYTAISIGWGWGRSDWYETPVVSSVPYLDSYINNNTQSTSKNNRIVNNLVYNIMNQLNDGGGIYALGAQPGLLIQGNYIYQDHNDFGALYLDDGSRYATVRFNVLESNVRNMIIKGSDHDIQYNYMDNTSNNMYWQIKSVLANNFAPGGSEYTSIKNNAGRFGTISYPESTVYQTHINPSLFKNAAYGSEAAAYYLDGSSATMHEGHQATKAVDGIAQDSSYAQAFGQYAWILQTDLGAVMDIDSVETYFQPDLYATEYAILTSTDGINWSEQKHVYNNSTLSVADDFAITSARYVRVKGIKPDGPDQTGNQMAIREVVVKKSDHALKLTAKTDGNTGNKYYYQSISTAPLTFQSGDKIVYQVYLTSNTNQTGGIDVLTTDNSWLRDFNVTDQNGVDARPFGDISSRAYQQWYQREITVPSGMVGKTVSKWMLAFENDQQNQLLGAIYDNFYVNRGGSNALTIYNSSTPSDNTTYYNTGNTAVTPAILVNGR